MTLRRSLQVGAVVTTAVSPLAAFAQGMGSVTTAPIAPAPALAVPLLVALAIALIGAGAYCLHARSRGAAAGFVLIAALCLLTGLSYATSEIVVQGTDCAMETVHAYSNGGTILTSLCPNPIQIIAITNPCDSLQLPSDGLPICAVGETLSNGQACRLPGCV